MPLLIPRYSRLCESPPLFSDFSENRSSLDTTTLPSLPHPQPFPFLHSSSVTVTVYLQVSSSGISDVEIPWVPTCPSLLLPLLQHTTSQNHNRIHNPRYSYLVKFNKLFFVLVIKVLHLPNSLHKRKNPSPSVITNSRLLFLGPHSLLTPTSHLLHQHPCSNVLLDFPTPTTCLHCDPPSFT